MDYNRYQLNAVMDSEGKPWVQRCFVCDKVVNYMRDAIGSWVKVGNLVRHRDCFPGAPK